MVRSLRFLLLSTLVAASACALLQRGEPILESETLSREEIAASGAIDCYGLVELLRPRWLAVRASTLRGDTVTAVVFLDETPQGDVEFLRAISASDVETIRYIDATDAVARYGRAYAAGIIQVVVKAG